MKSRKEPFHPAEPKGEENKKGLRKGLWLPACLAILAGILALGGWWLIREVREEAYLTALPRVPNLSIKTERLRRAIEEAGAEVRRRVSRGVPKSQVGRKIGELGRLYQANHFYDQAVQCYGLAMELDPGDARWPYFLAYILQEKGENEAVLELLERVSEQEPDYSLALLKLGDIHFKIGNQDQAKAYYERRLALSKGDPYALLGLARIALKSSQWKTAQTYLEKAIEQDPTFGNAHRLLASIHQHHGNTPKMQESQKRAAACTRFRPAPDPWIEELNDLCYDVDQLLVLGSKAIAELEIQKAAGFFFRAKELDQENPEVYIALGRLYFMVGQEEEARGSFEKAIDLDPKSDEALFHLGLILRSDRKLKEAEAMFLKALDFHPNNPNIYNNLGVTLLEQQRFKQAIKYLRQALEIYPEHINARYNLAMSLWGLGKTPEAIQQYKQILRIKPNWATAANSLAWILATDIDESIRNGDEAIRWATVACKGKGRENPEYLDTLAAAYAEARRFKQAVGTAKKSIGLARSAGDENLAQEVEHRLGLYRSNKAFHE